MATADPPPDESSDELNGRPTLTQNQSSRGNRLASDDPSAPGPRGGFLRVLVMWMWSTTHRTDQMDGREITLCLTLF